MPPRKSTEARLSAAAAGADDDTPMRKTKDGMGIEDLTLPRTMVQRLAKGVLPSNTQIQKDALLAIHRAATVFVSYLADSANDRAVLANKKTIQPKDVLEALAELEFEPFLPRCEKELVLYNTIQCTKRNDYRRRVKEEREAASESAILAATAAQEDGSSAEGDRGLLLDAGGSMGGEKVREGPPLAKRARVAVDGGGGGDGDETVSEEDEEGEGEGEEEGLSEDDEEMEEEEGEESEREEGGEAEDTLEMEMDGVRAGRYGVEDAEGGSESE